MQGTRLSFRSKEDAAHFAEKQGECLQYFRVFCFAQFDFTGWDHYVSVAVCNFYFLTDNPTGKQPRSSGFLPRTTLRTMCTSPTSSGLRGPSNPLAFRYIPVNRCCLYSMVSIVLEFISAKVSRGSKPSLTLVREHSNCGTIHVPYSQHLRPLYMPPSLI